MKTMYNPYILVNIVNFIRNKIAAFIGKILELNNIKIPFCVKFNLYYLKYLRWLFNEKKIRLFPCSSL